MKKIFTISFFTLLTIACSITITKAQQVYYYDFRNTFAESSGQGPALNVLGTGAFVDESLPELSCFSRAVYGFTQNSGIQFDNAAAGNFISGTYSIEMYFQFLNNSGFKRLIDFSNQGADTGLYCTSTELLFYDEVYIPTTAFVANQYVHLVVTRNDVSKEVSLYVDGAPVGSFTDLNNHAILQSSNVLNFFLDDTISGGESRPGRIALLKIYDTTLDSANVSDNFNSLETTSSALAFESDINSTCIA
ncbi:MAG TPA: hypothetical protein PKD91_08000, partial [Bacteroidia bacterium]|nr:hypothetical protein [Bacteroidia bacterium]